MRVAIDGPAGSGKSTVAKALSDRLGFTMLDTGAMYRAVTLACIRAEADLADDDAVARIARAAHIEFQADDAGVQRVLLDGRDVTEEIRTPEVDKKVSRVSAICEVREAMVEEQRRLASTLDVVAEGRDIGTVVFPEAEVKVYLTADAEARAHRRALQRNIDDPAQEKAILDDLQRRDEADSSRAASPLRVADDAYRMDSSSMTIEEEVDKIMELVNEVRDPAPQADPASKPETKSADEKGKKGKGDKESKKSQKPEDESADDAMAVFAHHEVEEFYEHPVRAFPLSARALLGTAIWACGATSKVLWHWTVEHGERLWKAEGGQVVVMNHVSMIDPVIVMVTDWIHGRRMRPIYKSEFDDHKLVNWFFARIGGIPVQRGTADIKAVRRAQRALQRGEDILIFPEGTRIHSDDQETQVHGGFALMAQLAKAPVLPVAIVGARDGAPGGNKPVRPGRVWLSVGEAITFDQIEEKSRKKRAEAMERLAMERVYALRDKLRFEHPGKM